MVHKEDESQLSPTSMLGSRPLPFSKRNGSRNSSSPTANSETAMYFQKNGSNGAVGSRYHQNGNGSYMHSNGMLPADQICRNRENDHKNFAELNDTFANYIENVRFLEAQNQSLTKQYDLLTVGLSEDAKSVEKMYENRLEKAQKLLEMANEQKREIESELPPLQRELDEIRKKYDDALNKKGNNEKELDAILKQLSAVEAEIVLAKRRIEILETTTANRLNKEKDRIRSELERANTALEDTTQQCAEHKSHLEKYTAELEKIANQPKPHDKAFVGMQIKMLRGMSPEDREFFKRELAKAINEIRAKNDLENEQYHSEMESKYWSLVEELQRGAIEERKNHEIKMLEVNELESSLNTYHKKLHAFNAQKMLLEAQEKEQMTAREEYERLHEAEMNDRSEDYKTLEEECTALKKQLDSLPSVDELNKELNRYAEILENEENRIALRQQSIVEARNYTENDTSVTTIRQQNESGMPLADIEHDTSQGELLIKDDISGRYIVLENKDPENEKILDGWMLKRTVDSNPEINFQLPKNFVLKPHKSVKIYARNQGGVHKPPEQLIWNDGDSFGAGMHVETFLLDQDGNIRASHTRSFDKQRLNDNETLV